MHRMKKLMALLLAASILCLSFSEEVLATDHIHIDGDLEDHAAQEETEIDEEMKDEEEPGAGDTSENQEDEQIENEEEKSEASGNEQTEESEEISGSLKDEEAIPVLPGNERPDTSEVMPEVPENVQTDVTGEVSENPEDEEKIEGPKDETPDVSAETPEDIGEQERKDQENTEYTESVSLQMDTLEAASWMNGLQYNEHFANWCFYKDNQILWDYTGLASNENGWWYVKNGVLDWNYTGVVSYGDGWWYVKNGQLDWSYTGVAPNENGWWYIKNGALDWSYTGVAPNENGWWYIKNGALDWSYTGVAPNENGWWYIKNGALDWSYTGVAPNENGWWYIKNGALDWSYTGLASNENGWWYIANGALDWNYTGVVSYGDGWWYVKNGQLDWSYTGVAPNENGWWYIKNGQLDWNYTGVAPNENGWWYIANGALDWNYTGLASNENGWWYIANGALDWNYTGVVSYGDGWWYVKNGQLDWSYTGVAPNENGWWYIKNGQLDWSYTGVAPNENGWWYIRNGALDWSYTGLASNENGWWYIRNGQLDWGYTGEVYHNGEKYRVVNGAVVFGDAAFRLNSCAASKNSNGHMTITLGIERNGTLESLYNEYYIVMLNGTGDSVINGVKGNILPGGAFRISADFYSNDEFRTTVMCKYALAAWNGQQYTIISNARYIDNPEVTATMTKSYMGYYTSDKITSKKGLQGVSEGYTEDLGVQHTLLNVNLADMVSMNARTGYVPYSYKGKTYYFQDMIALSRTVRYLNGWDLDNPYGSHKRSVTLVLLMGWNDELSYLIHPSARNRGAASYYALNMQDQNARDTFEALFCYMGEKLGDNKTLVSNWTLGNEVNSCRVWNYSGNMSLHECVANYAEAFQLLYQGVRRTASESKVFISLDHCWTASDAGHSGMEYLNEFAAYMSQTAPSVQWNVNYHPYSHPLNRNDFWSDNGNTTASWNTPYISMKNINVLTDYLGNIESSYGKPGGSIRVILGEIGFSAVKGNSGQENGQAAALGYGYYIALFNSRIDAYIARAYQDDPAEEQMGLYFGLRNRGDEKKVSYDVYKRLDTTESLAYMNPYLPYIQLSSWESAIPGFNAGALPAVDF